MKFTDELRMLFTPYELAATGMVLQYLFMVVGLIFALIFDWGLAAFLAFGIGVLLGIATWYGVTCPGCGKPLLKKYLLEERALGGLLYGNRGWPERVCSSCRTPMDIL
jgi:hypothetical protein